MSSVGNCIIEQPLQKQGKILIQLHSFSSPGRSPGRAIVLPPASALALALALASALALAAVSALAKC